MEKQRKPDLAVDNYTELEEKVDALMSKEKKRLGSKEDTVSAADNSDVKTAPVLPADSPAVADFEKTRVGVEDRLRSKVEEPTDSQAIDTPVTTGELEETPEQSENKTEKVIDNAETDEVVREIIAAEADELLRAEEGIQGASSQPATGSRIGKAVRAMGNWFMHGPHRGKALAITFVLVLMVGVIPSSRYAVLNVAGVRSSMSIKVIDDSTQQPLRNVTVQVGDSVAQTDENGSAQLDDLRHGNQVLRVQRRAFASREINFTVGWGSNPLGTYSLFPTGVQYTFMLTDYLTKEPVRDAEIAFGDTTAFANNDGAATLTIEPEDDAPVIEVAVISEQYREDVIRVEASMQDTIEVVLAPRLQHFFVSERSGQADVYGVYADGQQEQVLLPGTGTERKDIKLLPHPERNLVAVSSTRSGDRNQDGFLLSNLTVIDADNDERVVADTSERIQFVGWQGDRLVYVKISQGASGTNPERHQLISYDAIANRRYVLAASNYFNGVVMIDGTVFFAPSSLFQDTREKLYRVDADGENEAVVLGRESWGLYRTSFEQLSVVTSSSWFGLDVESWETEELPGEPARVDSRLYIRSPDDERPLYAWVEQRDGQGVLLVYDPRSEADRIIRSDPGLGYPLRWLNATTLVYRVQTQSETADYLVSVEDGSVDKKLVDVAPSSGVEQWY